MIAIQRPYTAGSFRILRLCSAKRLQRPDYGYYLTVISTKACPNLITRQRKGGHPFALHCEAGSIRIFFTGYFNDFFSTEPARTLRDASLEVSRNSGQVSLQE